MRLVVGLGNPGPKYRGTRHNIGFEIVDELARRAGVRFESSPVDALVARLRVAGEADGVLLAKPLTFMNASGQAVGGLMRYFKIAPADVLVIVDEVQLPLARLRARPRGSAGGHNGLKSLVAHIGSDFPRLRVGVGRGDARRDLADHVLSRFEGDEADQVTAMIARGADAAEVFLARGIDAVMNGFNSADDEVGREAKAPGAEASEAKGAASGGRENEKT